MATLNFFLFLVCFEMSFSIDKKLTSSLFYNITFYWYRLILLSFYFLFVLNFFFFFSVEILRMYFLGFFGYLWGPCS